MRRVLPVLLICAFVPACAPATDGVGAGAFSSTPRLTAALTADGSVLLTLTNNSAGPIGYNLCTSTFQRKNGSTWTDVPMTHMCTMELRTLPPDGQDTFTHEVPADLSGGEYRMITNIERPLGSHQMGLASNSFTLSR